MDVKEQPQKWPEWIPFVVVPLLVGLAHVLCINNYGYFRDELYYLSCADRLSWGYVDHPPFSVFVLRVCVAIFGDSLGAFRWTLVLSSMATVLAIMGSAKQLGVGWTGIWIAGLFSALSGVFLVVFSFYSMNAFDIMFWALAGYVLIAILKEPSLRLWLILATILGLAFLNKASALWLVAGIFFGLLLTPYRKLLMDWRPWISLLATIGIVSPHIVWQIANGWPTLEFAKNAQEHKLLPLVPWEFFAQQFVVANMVAFVFIAIALVAAFFKPWKKWLPLAIVFFFVLAVLLINGKSRVNYLAPAYTLVLPLAAAISEAWIGSSRPKLFVITALLTVTAPLYLVFGLPWLAPQKMGWLIGFSPIQPPVEEKGAKSPIQGWADMFGWEELAEAVKEVQSNMSSDEKLKVMVVANNYGEAAALEHYKVGPVICGHNNFWLWGYHDWTGEVGIFVNEWPFEIKSMFESFEEVGKVEAPYAVPEQNGSPIWIARKLKVPMATFWAKMRKYI